MPVFTPLYAVKQEPKLNEIPKTDSDIISFTAPAPAPSGEPLYAVHNDSKPAEPIRPAPAAIPVPEPAAEPETVEETAEPEEPQKPEKKKKGWWIFGKKNKEDDGE